MNATSPCANCGAEADPSSTDPRPDRRKQRRTAKIQVEGAVGRAVLIAIAYLVLSVIAVVAVVVAAVLLR